MKRRVVLVGHNFNSILGLARVLAPEGHEVVVIRTGVATGKNPLRRIGQMPEAKSKCIHHYRIASIENKERILKLIGECASESKKGILIPVDDLCAELIDQHYDELSRRFYLPNVNDTQGGVCILMDKFYQKKLAKAAGLPVPEGWSVEVKGGSFTIPDEVTYPCFAKAETPMRGRKKYMGKCENREELEKLIRSVASVQDCLMLVEEYVEIEKEYGTVGFCSKGKVCIPGITEKTVLGHGSNAGVTACGLIHKPSDWPDTVEGMRKMMADSGFRGLFDIDLYLSNGKMYFNELNVRMGAEGVGVLMAGVNLAEMFIRSFTEEAATIDYDAEAAPITFASEKPLISDWGENTIRYKDYKAYTKQVEKLVIYDPEDRGPARNFKWQILRQAVRKVVKKVKR